MAVSAGGQGPPVAGDHQGACLFSFYTPWVPVVPPQGRNTVMKVLEMSQWVWRGLGGLTIRLCRVDLQPHTSI